MTTAAAQTFKREWHTALKTVIDGDDPMAKYNTGKLLDALHKVGALRDGVGETKALADVAAERKRQIADECWTPGHDDEHGNGEMAKAAACYCLTSRSPKQLQVSLKGPHQPLPIKAMWPWRMLWFKPKNPRRDLVRAGALILAEIERLDRALPPAPLAPVAAQKTKKEAGE